MVSTVTAKRLFRTFNEVRQKKSWYQRVRDHRAFVPLKYETDDFLLMTAEGGQDLLRVLELRHQVFVEEWQGRQAYHGLDVDKYDFIADHLIIIDKRKDEVVGTYRLLSSHFTQEFYSASEFEIGEFLRLPSVKLELGRACVHPNYRNGATMDLLWKGLSQYIVRTKTEFLFGCSSLKTTDPDSANRLFATLKQEDQWSDDFQIRPTKKYRFTDCLSVPSASLTPAERRGLLPPLLRSYLHAGAKVHGWPALDREFACLDLLTILDWKGLNPKFQSRFLVGG